MQRRNTAIIGNRLQRALFPTAYAIYAGWVQDWRLAARRSNSHVKLCGSFPTLAIGGISTRPTHNFVATVLGARNVLQRGLNSQHIERTLIQIVGVSKEVVQALSIECHGHRAITIITILFFVNVIVECMLSMFDCHAEVMYGY